MAQFRRVEPRRGKQLAGMRGGIATRGPTASVIKSNMMSAVRPVSKGKSIEAQYTCAHRAFLHGAQLTRNLDAT